MNFISTLIVWTWLLGIAIVLPATLPAGGAQKSIIQSRKNIIGSPIIALKEFNLLCSASKKSSVLTRVETGTPVNVLRVLDTNDNGQWLLVKIISQEFYQFFYKRGWVNVRNS
tara:strand:- start:1150 stop:1488 length:339 start_codon:yes stop_codon:yes gene_type:complete